MLDRRIERVDDPWNAQLRGVALWTLICMGRLSLADEANRVAVSAVFEPDPAHRALYARHMREYRRLYGPLKGLSRRMNS